MFISIPEFHIYIVKKKNEKVCFFDLTNIHVDLQKSRQENFSSSHTDLYKKVKNDFAYDGMIFEKRMGKIPL